MRKDVKKTANWIPDYLLIIRIHRKPVSNINLSGMCEYECVSRLPVYTSCASEIADGEELCVSQNFHRSAQTWVLGPLLCCPPLPSSTRNQVAVATGGFTHSKREQRL